jgi:EmrB/QacA subfamily drug resistance transporter
MRGDVEGEMSAGGLSTTATTTAAPPRGTAENPIPLSYAGPARPPPVDKAALAQAAGVDRRFVTAALMLVMVLASMEMTITSTAMPTIIGDLHGLEHYSWVASIYLLASTITMPLYGRLADALGRKRVILGAIVLFMCGSIFAAFSRSMAQLIAFRAIQGLGAGGIMPVVLTILGDIFTLEERARIQGLFSLVWGSAALLGPTLGAFLVHALGWRSVFWVNVPLGALGLVMLLWKYKDLEKPHKTDLDLPGIAALSLAGISLLALVSRLGPDGWSTAALVALATVGAACCGFLVWHERRAEHPVLPPELLVRRSIGPPILAAFLFGAGFLCLDTYVPLYVQGGRGGGVGAAAGVVTPVMLTWALSSMLAAPFLVRWGFRKTAFVGTLLIVAGFAGLLICAWTGAPRWLITAVLAITGFGFGPASMSQLLAAQDSVAWQQRGIVTSAVGFFRTIGGALGIGLLGAMFNALIAKDLAWLREQGVTPGSLLDPHSAKGLPPQVAAQAQSAIARGLTWVFAAMLAIALLQLAVTALMPPKRADHAPSASEGLAV